MNAVLPLFQQTAQLWGCGDATVP